MLHQKSWHSTVILLSLESLILPPFLKLPGFCFSLFFFFLTKIFIHFINLVELDMAQ